MVSDRAGQLSVAPRVSECFAIALTMLTRSAHSALASGESARRSGEAANGHQEGKVRRRRNWNPARAV